jgi:flavin-dependent dehydrogenase
VIERETIVVGGGPGGASAAWQLKQDGREALVLDREPFPREKLCAGWITPEVLDDLEFSPAQYPHRFLTFDALQVNLWGMHFALRSPQHSIRRIEFDHWLLERSDAEFSVHEVKNIKQTVDGYVIDDRYRCRHLIGAGGTRCPVFRRLFRDTAPHDKALQAVALELEYPFNWHDPDCHLWFLNHGLPGYSWYVPKARGYLNIGVGGMAARLHDNGDDIKRHWQLLVERLLQRGLIDKDPGQPKGYSYFLAAKTAVNRRDNAYIVGDALGLATRDMCEGIGPAVRSGLLAARAISGNQVKNIQEIPRYTSNVTFVRRGLERCLLKNH